LPFGGIRWRTTPLNWHKSLLPRRADRRCWLSGGPPGKPLALPAAEPREYEPSGGLFQRWAEGQGPRRGVLRAEPFSATRTRRGPWRSAEPRWRLSRGRCRPRRGRRRGRTASAAAPRRRPALPPEGAPQPAAAATPAGRRRRRRPPGGCRTARGQQPGGEAAGNDEEDAAQPPDRSGQGNVAPVYVMPETDVTRAGCLLLRPAV
jgi:hypothetical protein